MNENVWVVWKRLLGFVPCQRATAVFMEFSISEASGVTKLLYMELDRLQTLLEHWTEENSYKKNLLTFGKEAERAT